MFNKISTNFQNAVDTVGLKGTKMINTIRGVESTVDQDFETHRNQFDNYSTSIDKMINSVKMNMSSAMSFRDSLRNLGTSLVLFSGDENGFPVAGNYAQSAEAFSVQLETFISSTRQFDAALKNISDALMVAKKEINERDRWQVAFDQARHDLSAEMKKQPPNPAQQQICQRNLETAKGLYEQRNVDGMRQIQNILAARNISSEFAQYNAALVTFLQSGSQVFTPYTSPQPTNFRAPSQMPARTTPSLVSSTGYSSTAGAGMSAAVAPSAGMYSQGMQSQQQAPPNLPRKTSQPQPPSNVKQAKALYPFVPQAPSELALQPGDIITLINDSHPDWWTGSVRGQSGEFPANYVQRI